MKTYCIRRCISICHSNSGDKAHKHIHTIEIAAYIKNMEGQFQVIRFEEIENMLDSGLALYQNEYLNDMKGFEENVSIEHLGEILFYRLDEVLNDKGLFMEKFEISETPLRTYIIARTI